MALRLVPLLGLAGVAMACLLLPGIAALGTAYGLSCCAPRRYCLSHSWVLRR